MRRRPYAVCQIVGGLSSLETNSFSSAEIEVEENSVPWVSAGTNITLYLSGIERVNIGYAGITPPSGSPDVIASQRRQCRVPTSKSRASRLQVRRTNNTI